MDSEYLKKEFERQAALAYQAGRYTLKKLDIRGQRVNIVITLTRNGQSKTVISGWMVFPNGKLVCTAPYGDK